MLHYAIYLIYILCNLVTEGTTYQMDCLVQDCGISSVLVMEILQSSTKSSRYHIQHSISPIVMTALLYVSQFSTLDVPFIGLWIQ